MSERRLERLSKPQPPTATSSIATPAQLKFKGKLTHQLDCLRAAQAALGHKHNERRVNPLPCPKAKEVGSKVETEGLEPTIDKSTLSSSHFPRELLRSISTSGSGSTEDADTLLSLSLRREVSRQLSERSPGSLQLRPSVSGSRPLSRHNSGLQAENSGSQPLSLSDSTPRPLSRHNSDLKAEGSATQPHSPLASISRPLSRHNSGLLAEDSAAQPINSSTPPHHSPSKLSTRQRSASHPRSPAASDSCRSPARSPLTRQRSGVEAEPLTPKRQRSGVEAEGSPLTRQRSGVVAKGSPSAREQSGVEAEGPPLARKRSGFRVEGSPPARQRPAVEAEGSAAKPHRAAAPQLVNPQLTRQRSGSQQPSSCSPQPNVSSARHTTVGVASPLSPLPPHRTKRQRSQPLSPSASHEPPDESHDAAGVEVASGADGEDHVAGGAGAVGNGGAHGRKAPVVEQSANQIAGVVEPAVDNSMEETGTARVTGITKRRKIVDTICKFCEKEFADAGKLRRHVQAVHEGLRKFKCRFCDHTSAQKGNMDRHEQYHHKEELRAYRKQKHTCTECSRSFVEFSKLRDHMRIHSGEKFKCEWCDSQYVALYKLNQHQKKCKSRPVAVDL